MSHSPLRFKSDKRVIALISWCSVVVLGLGLADYVIVFLGFYPSKAVREIFDISREDALATWFQSFQTLAISVSLFLIYVSTKAMDHKKWIQRSWLFLSGVFLYLSIDDGARLHERISGALKNALGIYTWLGRYFPSYSWQLVLGPIFVMIGFYMLWFLWRHFIRRFSFWLLFVAFALLFLAQSLDFIEGLRHPPYAELGAILGFDERQILHLSRLVEECLEMFGMGLILNAFLLQLFEMVACIRITFKNSHNQLEIESIPADVTS